MAVAPAPPPPPPPPPSPAEVLADTPFPQARVETNPSTLGLTQLPTWFSVAGVGGQISATVTIRGYTVVTTADPVSFAWFFGDGGSATGSGAGSATVPSVTHTYKEKGRYEVTVQVSWAGRYSFQGNGVGPETVPLGTVEGPVEAETYGVQEVRSVATGA